MVGSCELFFISFSYLLVAWKGETATNTASAAPAERAPNAKAERLKAEGNDHFQAKRYPDAIHCYTEAISEAPQDHVLYSNRSFALFHARDYRAASRDAYQCVRLAKSWPKGYYRLGLALSGLGLYAKALEAFGVGLVAAPQNAELRAGFAKAREAAESQSMSTITWHQHPVLSESAESPRQRCTHSLTQFGARLVCFGGFGQGLLNDVSVVQTDTLTLTPDVAARSEVSPCPRSGHTAVGSDCEMVVFGGFDGEKTYFNDAWALDVPSCRWRRIETRGTPPRARCSHTSVLFGAEMYVFGGTTAEGGPGCLDEVAMLDLRSGTWSYPQVKGTTPQARNSHASCLVGSRMVVFGGCQGASRYFNDVHTLDLRDWTWRQLAVSGEAPEERMGMGMVALGSRLYVHGGLVVKDKTYRADTYLLDLDSTSWVPLDLAGAVPMPRGGHAMATVRGSKLLSYGGDGGPSLGILRDVWIADTDLEVCNLRSAALENELELHNLQQSRTSAR